MLTALRPPDRTSSALRTRVVGVYLFLALFNLVAWGSPSRRRRLPDHAPTPSSPTRSASATPSIPTTSGHRQLHRKLMQDGQRPSESALLLARTLDHRRALTVLVGSRPGSSAGSCRPEGRRLIGMAVSGRSSSSSDHQSRRLIRHLRCSGSVAGGSLQRGEP